MRCHYSSRKVHNREIMEAKRQEALNDKTVRQKNEFIWALYPDLNRGLPTFIE